MAPKKEDSKRPSKPDPEKESAKTVASARTEAPKEGGKKDAKPEPLGTDKASKTLSRQQKAAMEAARQEAVEAMLNPPCDDEGSSDLEDRPPTSTGGGRGGTAIAAKDRKAQEKEFLDRQREEARQRREERLAERELEQESKSSRADLAKVLAKVEAGDEKKLSNKERRLYAKHFKQLEEEAEMGAHQVAIEQMGADNARILEAVDNFSVSMADDSSAQEGAVDLRLENFSVSAGSTQLFENASLILASGRRYGVLGPNGQGKTTLLRLLAVGRLPVPSHWRVALVEQEAEATEASVVEEVLSSDTRRRQLLVEETQLLAKLESCDESHSGDSEAVAEAITALCDRLVAVGEELEVTGAEAAEAKVRRILYGLAFTSDMADGPVSRLSGGWRMRVSLAKALFLEPDLLLLDEPTNHLDLDAVLWLDDYLGSYPKTLLVVSHDADFLDSVCTDILHLEERKLNSYRGGYTQFKKAHALRVKEREKEFNKQQEEKKKGKKVLEDDQVTKLPDYVVKFRFLEPRRDDEMAGISVNDVSFSYSGKPPWLLKGLNFRIDCSTRVTVLGVNGSGKSTLLSLVAKVLEPCTGEVYHSRKLTIGRYSQHFDEIAPYLHMSAVEFLTSHELRRFGAGTENPELAHKCLGQFGLPSQAHRRPMKELSGGQKSRVCFASITCRAPELLVLDEPTNHLDIQSVEALIDALRRYKGGLLLVTHDARLIQATECELRVCHGASDPELGKVASFEAYRRQVLSALAKRQAEAEMISKQRAAIRKKQREDALQKRATVTRKGFDPPGRR